MYFDGNTHPYGPINSRCLQRYNELGIISSRQLILKIQLQRFGVKVYVEETNGIQPPNFSYGMNKASTKMGFGFATWGNWLSKL